MKPGWRIITTLDTLLLYYQARIKTVKSWTAKEQQSTSMLETILSGYVYIKHSL